MDPTLLANNPIVKTFGRYVKIALVIEIAIFVLVCFLTSFQLAFWVTIGFTLLGYSIKPFKNPAEKKMPGLPAEMPFSTFKSTRTICGTLFMIPGFLSDVAAILLFIPFVRRKTVDWGKKLAAKKMQKLGMGGMDPNMFSSLLQNMQNMQNMQNGAAGFTNMGGNQEVSSPASNAKSDKDARKKRERHKQPQTVDIDYEVRDGDGVWIGGHAEQPTDLVVSMKHDHAPKKEEDDVIDIG